MYIRIRKKWQSVLDYTMILLGCFVMGFSFSVFLEPNQITTGGFSGVAMMLSSMLALAGIKIQSSVIYLILNVFLFILALKQLGKKFAVRALVGIFGFSLAMELFAIIPFNYEYDNIIASIFGGLLTGFGVGLVVRFGGSTGGTDMIALMIRKRHKSFHMGKLVVAIDAVVVLLSLFVYSDGLKLLPYTIIALFVYAISTDLVNENYKQVRAYTIITSKPDEMAEKIMAATVRGCTRMNATGMYTKKELSSIVCLVSKQQVGMMHQIIGEVDPNAFVYSTSVIEVLGSWTHEKDIPSSKEILGNKSKDKNTKNKEHLNAENTIDESSKKED